MNERLEMTLSELHIKLSKKGISENKYFLHGLFGSTDDNDKIALSIRKRESKIEYETYYKERGEKHSIRIFEVENQACEFIYKKLINEQTLNKIQEIDRLEGMTVNERLWKSGLIDEFGKAKIKDKSRAKEILRWLKVDKDSIEKIVK